jgi:chromosomal replication initiator protein
MDGPTCVASVILVDTHQFTTATWPGNPLPPPPRTAPLLPDLASNTLSHHLQERVGKTPFQMWFAEASMGLEDGVLRIGASSQFQADWISRRYENDLRIVSEASGGHATDVFVRADAATDIKDTLKSLTNEGEPSPRRAPRPRRRLLVLDDMAVGPCNRLAIAAAKSIVDDPDAHHLSPLFIHGDCGVGKTHLLQGICHRFANTHPGEPMRYITGEDFTNQYIQAVRHNQLERFRNTMRRLQLLAIDDVHFVAGKTRTQDEVLFTLDAMRLSGARLVLASDAAPGVIKRFNKALASRCTSGMLVQVDVPATAMRREITSRLATHRGMTLSGDATDLVVEHCPTGPRDIQGLLARVAAVRSVRGARGTVTDQDVREAIGYQRREVHRPVTVDRLATAACQVLRIETSELMGPRRASRLVAGRGLVAFLARELTNASYPEIARALSRKTHSSVHASVRRVRREFETGHTIELGGEQILLEHLCDQIRRAARQD